MSQLMKNKIANCLYGVFYGDAIGAPVEKLSYQQIYEKYGRVESFDIEYHKNSLKVVHVPRKKRGGGIFTDDSLMTLCLIDVYDEVRKHLDVFNMNEQFVKNVCFKPRYIPEFGYEALVVDRVFIPEKYIFLKHTLANSDPRSAGVGNMVNCGAMMYCAPIGIINACNPEQAYSEAINFCQGHQYSYGLEAAGVFSATLAKAFEPNVTVEALMNTAIEFANDGTKNALIAMKQCVDQLDGQAVDMLELYRLLHEAIKPYSPMGDDVDRHIDKVGKPSIHYTESRLFSIEELPIALAIIYYSGTEFYDVIHDGINSGRDTDSIGVVIGAILGAMKNKQVYTTEEKELLEEVNRFNLDLETNKLFEVFKELQQEEKEKVERILKNRESILGE